MSIKNHELKNGQHVKISFPRNNENSDSNSEASEGDESVPESPPGEALYKSHIMSVQMLRRSLCYIKMTIVRTLSMEIVIVTA